MTYEFVCPNCETVFTAKADIKTAKPEPICEQCGYRMIPVWGSPSISLKGSGWGKDAR